MVEISQIIFEIVRSEFNKLCGEKVDESKKAGLSFETDDRQNWIEVKTISENRNANSVCN